MINFGTLDVCLRRTIYFTTPALAQVLMGRGRWDKLNESSIHVGYSPQRKIESADSEEEAWGLAAQPTELRNAQWSSMRSTIKDIKRQSALLRGQLETQANMLSKQELQLAKQKEWAENVVAKQGDTVLKMGQQLEMFARVAVLCAERMRQDNLPDAALLPPLSVPALSPPPLPSPSKPSLATSPLTPSPRLATLRSGSAALCRRARRRLFDSASSKAALPSRSDFGPPASRSPSPSVRRSLPSQSSPSLHGLLQVSPPQLSCHAMHVWSLLSISPSCVRSHGLTSRAGWQRRARGCAGWTYI